MALTTGFQLPFGIQPLNPVPTDSWSGPYEGASTVAALSAANASIPSGVRFKSLEVRLVINGVAAKYWYKNGTADSDLVEFSSSSLPAAATFTTSVSAPALSGTFYGNGSNLQGITNISNGSSKFTIPSSNGDAFVNINDGTAEWKFSSNGELALPPGKLINWGQNVGTLGPPLSSGATDKLRLWDFYGSNPSGFNYAIGVEGNHMWFGMDVNNGTGGFKFYSQDDEIFKIVDNGSLNVKNNISGVQGASRITDFIVDGGFY